jgi:endo-1,4-beta-mannosidase
MSREKPENATYINDLKWLNMVTLRVSTIKLSEIMTTKFVRDFMAVINKMLREGTDHKK